MLRTKPNITPSTDPQTAVGMYACGQSGYGGAGKLHSSQVNEHTRGFGEVGVLQIPNTQKAPQLYQVHTARKRMPGTSTVLLLVQHLWYKKQTTCGTHVRNNESAHSRLGRRKMETPSVPTRARGPRKAATRSLHWQCLLPFTTQGDVYPFARSG